MSEVLTTYEPIQVLTYDPTRTLTLRNAFVKDMNRRFRALIKVIKEAVVDQDCFGLSMPVYAELTPPYHRAFDFPRVKQKVEAFMEWLKTQEALGLLETSRSYRTGVAVEEPWTNIYIEDSYKRGVARARYEARKSKYNVPTLEESGGIEAVMGGSFHVDRVGLVFTRAFSELQGITAQMDTKISQILAQGLVDGDGAELLARKIVAIVNGEGLGELGITDSLGRVIPAQQRARTLARTEIIRAHHAANMQEYMNWKVLGVQVMAEFSTAGDDRVCAECASYHGNTYTLKEAEHMIPVHPNCFIDPQIPIYTSEGWKPIGEIKVGDLVLTHKHRFRKVTQLIRTPKQTPEVVWFKLVGGLRISMTSNHPVLAIGPGESSATWIEAGRVTADHKLLVLASTCERCGEKIPYFRKYCSRTCLSLDITDKQWADPEHRKNISEKATKQMDREYRSGVRDKNTITRQANKKVKELVEKGVFVFQRPETRARIREATNTPEHCLASSKRMLGDGNPMRDPVTREKATKALLDLYENHPEKRLNARMAKHRKSGRMTGIEKQMSEVLDRVEVDYVFQYPILRYNVDFAIPELKIAIECDGLYWHQDEEKDLIRQKNIEEEGWTVLRFNDAEINQGIEIIEEELSRVLCNHLGEYGSIPIGIENITKREVKRARTLYNFSVEEDESYVAKGIVVHNCRCIALPLVNTER